MSLASNKDYELFKDLGKMTILKLYEIENFKFHKHLPSYVKNLCFHQLLFAKIKKYIEDYKGNLLVYRIVFLFLCFFHV